jgi:hypothetical protein
MNAIKKLQEHNIFKRDSIVESTIMKDWMGSPVEKKVASYSEENRARGLLV